MLAASSLPEDGPAVHVRVRHDQLELDHAGPSSTVSATAFYGPGTGQLFARSGLGHPRDLDQHERRPVHAEPRAPRSGRADDLQRWLGSAYDPVIGLALRAAQAIDDHGTLRVLKDATTPDEQMMGAATAMLALHKGDGYVHAAADLSPVYGSAVTKFQRE